MGAGGPPPIDLNPFEAPRTVGEAPSPPVPSAGFRSLSPLANAITAAMALIILVGCLEIAGDAVSISVMQRARDSGVFDRGEWAAISWRSEQAALARNILFLAAAILFCFFMPRANRNARAFGSQRMSFTPRWTAAVFFVPVWCLYKPYRAMKEIWLGSEPDVTRSPSTVSFPSVFAWWWGTFLCLSVLTRILSADSKNAKTTEAVLSQFHWDIVESIVMIGAATLALIVVRALAQRQDERQTRFPAGTGAAVAS